MNLLGPYRFNLQTTVFYELRSLHCFYHCCRTHLMSAILELRNGTNNSSTTYILLYNVVCLWQDPGGWELINSHGPGTFVCPLNTGLGIGSETYGHYVSSWWYPVWLRYWLYMICNKLSKWDGLWWPVLYRHRLSCNGWQKWLTHSKSIIQMCLQSHTPGVFLSSDFLWEHRNDSVTVELPDIVFKYSAGVFSGFVTGCFCSI